MEILKDRIILLRNRFNLEKRKVDNCRSDDNPNPTSTWPLYKYMTFLIGHVRQRKTIKMLQKMRELAALNGGGGGGVKTHKNTRKYMKSIEMSNNCSVQSNNNQRNNSDVGIDGNTSETTKLEYNSDDDDDDSVQIMDDLYDQNNDISSIMNGSDNHHQRLSSHDEEDDGSHIPDILMTSENDDDCGHMNGGNVDGCMNGVGGMNDQFDPEASDSSLRQLPRMYRPNENLDYSQAPKLMPMLYTKEDQTRTNKYNSFGHFIATSLCDLPDDKALDLMQKFSMDIINAMRTNM